MLIDTHCHLQHAKFGDEPARTPAQLMADAKAAGVEQLITIACRRTEWAPALVLAENTESLFVGAGVHPHDARENVTSDELARLAQHPKVVALGETGLDYYYDTSPRDVQQESFHCHLYAASEWDLPTIIHTREAEADTLAILKEHMPQAFVLHCFTGTRSMAEAAIAMGGYISFSGVLTFKKSDDLRAIAAALPRDRVLVETDAPYLAPEPNRGKRCAPAHVVHTAACLARVWDVSEAEVARITKANAQQLFPKITSAV